MCTASLQPFRVTDQEQRSKGRQGLVSQVGRAPAPGSSERRTQGSLLGMAWAFPMAQSSWHFG